MSFFRYVLSAEYGWLICFYTLIFFSVSFCAFRCQKIKEDGTIITQNGWFMVSFLIAWVFYVLTRNGADLQQYLAIYEKSELTLKYITGIGVEPGYRFINALLHTFISNELLGIGIIKTLQISLVFASIWLLRGKILVGYSVMAYMAIFYFSSFNLIRISLASSMCIFATVLSLKNNKIKALVLAGFSFFIHNSAFVFVFTLILEYLYTKLKGFRKAIGVTLMVCIPIMVLFGREIILAILSTGKFNERYYNYISASSSFGIVQIIYYLPVFIMLYNLILSKKAFEFKETGFIHTVVGFGVAMLSYMIGMLSRMAVFFFVPFMIIIPYYLKNQKIMEGKFLKVKLSSVLTKWIIIIYWLVRYILEMSGQFMAAGIDKISVI